MATVKKMADYGLNLDSAESEKIAAALAARPKDTNTFGQGSPIVDLAARPDQLVPASSLKGRPRHGAAVFSKYCAACHGAMAEGQIGPRLRGRLITDAVFWTTVNHGKQKMPAFADSLGARDLADIKAWLAR
jgi:mono/diheme cytochrome c family protein